jgi:hypothetical protein
VTRQLRKEIAQIYEKVAKTVVKLKIAIISASKGSI